MASRDDMELNVIDVTYDEFVEEAMGGFSGDKKAGKLGSVFEELRSGDAKVKAIHKVPGPRKYARTIIIIIVTRKVIVIIVIRGR